MRGIRDKGLGAVEGGAGSEGAPSKRLRIRSAAARCMKGLKAAILPVILDMRSCLPIFNHRPGSRSRKRGGMVQGTLA